MKKKLVILFLSIAISFLSGCKVDREQSFKEMWNLVSIGNTKDSAVAMLGKPSSIESIEVPIISTEKIDWNVDGNTYTLRIYLGRVVSKEVAVKSDSCFLKTSCL